MPRHTRTDRIDIDTSRCTACGKCMDACAHGVLAVRGPKFHRHVHVVKSAKCTGCLTCVRKCPEGAIRAK